jgi:hypothetical protein
MAFDNITKEELIEKKTDARARDIIMLLKILISQVGKEKAKELFKKARWETYYQRGREAARRAGNPKDLNSYIEKYYFEEVPATVPWIAPLNWVERTSNKAIWRETSYCLGEALNKLGDDEIKEIGKEAFCVHDIAWAIGFNPDIKMHYSKIFYNGDNCCECVIEI